MASWGGEHSRWCEHLEWRPLGGSKHLQTVECGQTERGLWSRSREMGVRDRSSRGFGSHHMAMGKMGNHCWILSRGLQGLTFILISRWMLFGQWTAEGLLEGGEGRPLVIGWHSHLVEGQEWEGPNGVVRHCHYLERRTGKDAPKVCILKKVEDVQVESSSSSWSCYTGVEKLGLKL